MKSAHEVVAGLEPEGLWRHFADISRIPRGSRNEAAIAKHVLDSAARLGLFAKQDAHGNVLVRKPAFQGREGARRICLQGHLDMVCEKNKEKVFDFAKDPIELVRRGNLLCANGTTLGGDNGIAVAAQLAVMEDRTLVHGPLEFLCTVEEETDLTGASSLTEGFVESRTLVNLDSEEEGTLYVGCAGGKDTVGTFTMSTVAAPRASIAGTVSVEGLKGGHSGLDIDRGRGNAIRILARACLVLAQLGGRVTTIRGGNKRNAIPREAEALVVIPASNWAAATEGIAALEGKVKQELAGFETDVCVSLVQDGRAPSKAFDERHQQSLLATLEALPHGVVKMSDDIPGLVETSTNLAAVETRRGSRGTVVLVATSQRSSVASEVQEIADLVRQSLVAGGAEVSQGSGYPGWKPNLESEILDVTRRSFRELFGKDPRVTAIHAGLECGTIGERYPGIDMVSFGPTLEAVHSPDERIHIDTVLRFWKLLLAVLAKLD